MSTQITTAFVQQYNNNVQMLSQQKGSLLRSAVSVESINAKNAFFDQVGVATAVKRTSRHADFLKNVRFKFGELLGNPLRTISSLAL
tara:strand:- start:187 stop:447 length:261 start_codon:yes stop_codon:yes gene_type:complete